MKTKTLVIRVGDRHTIRVIAFPAPEGETRLPCPTLEFFAEQKTRDPDELKKLAALLTRTADHGVPQNIEQFRPLKNADGLYEFKTGGGLRLFCFWDEDDLIVCTHGVVKKSQKTPPGAIEHAGKLRKRYLEAKQKRELTHVPSPKH